MSPEAQRIAIAEHCGWRSFPYVVVNGRKYAGPHWSNYPDFDPDDPHPGTVACGINNLPDYLRNLNAIHHVENTLADNEASYACELASVVGVKHWLPETGISVFRIAHATAAQRAEAFLRTIGKWQETEAACS